MKGITRTALAVLAFILWGAAPSWATVYYVSPTGNDANDGLSPATAVHSIQVGIDRATPNGEVRVAEGTYQGWYYVNGPVSVKGGYSSDFASSSPSTSPTVLRGNPLRYGFQINPVDEPGRVVIDGFTIEGFQTGVYAYNASTTVTRCNLLWNNCGFFLNGWRNGLTATVTDDIVAYNTQSTLRNWCPGVQCRLPAGMAIIERNTIACNGGSNPSYANAGGLRIYGVPDEPTVSVRYNRLQGNTAQYHGGGMWVSGSGVIANNLVTDNYAAQAGGGVFTSAYGHISVVNNTIARNRAAYIGGLFVYSDPSLSPPLNTHALVANNIMADNSWVGLHVRTGSVVDLRTNCLWDNMGVDYDDAVPQPNNDLHAPPLFADPANGNFRLLRPSVCRDAGNDDAATGLDVDLDGSPRFAGGTTVSDSTTLSAVDIGCYEAQETLPLYFRDTFDLTEWTSGANTDINYQNALRQIGTLGVVPYEEDPETGTWEDFETQVSNGGSQKLMLGLWSLNPYYRPRVTNSVSPSHSFTESGDHAITCDISNDGWNCTDMWSSLTFGTSERAAGSNTPGSTVPGGPTIAGGGTGVVIRVGDTATAYDAGVPVWSGGISALRSPVTGTYSVTYIVHADANLVGPATWQLYIGGTKVCEGARPGGYPGGWVTLTSYANPQATDPNYWNYGQFGYYDNLRVEAIPPITDTAAPVSTAQVLDEPGPSGFIAPAARVRITADDAGGSGVRDVRYRVDSGGEVTAPGATANLAVYQTGNHTVSYWSTDNAGNVEQPKSVTFGPVDGTPPVTSMTYDKPIPASYWFRENVTLTLKGTDEPGGSGVQSVSYWLNGAPGWVTVPGDTVVLPFTQDGVNYARNYSTDNAGNVESDNIAYVRIDKTAPLTTASPDRAPGANGWYNGDVSVTLVSQDAYCAGGSSSVKTLTYQIGQAAPVTLSRQSGSTSITATPVIATEGVNALTYWAVDYAGNEEEHKTLVFKVDKTVPTAVDDSYETAEDTVLDIPARGVLANDADVEPMALSAVLVASPANGTVDLRPDGSFTYAPAKDFYGSDTFTYRANDGALDSNVATVSITVTPVNDAPVAGDQSVTTAEDTPMAITLSATDVDSTTLTYAVVTPPSHGTLTGSAPDLTYTPTANYNGPDSFTYKANDGQLDSNVATVTITVTPVNDPPVAVDDQVTTSKNTAVIVNVLANDPADIDGDAVTVSTVTQGTHGSVTINPNSTVTYTPVAGYYGADSFTYTVSDGHGGTATATVSVTITNTAPTNNPPTAVNDSAATANHTPVIVNVLANDSDPDPGDSVSLVSVTQPANGTVAINPDDTVTYTPAGAFNGTDKFTYTITDGKALSTATVAVQVAANGNPNAVADAYATDNLTPIIISPASNDTDPENDALHLTGVAVPSSGTAALNGDGTVTYTPASTFKGKATFTYTVADNYGGTATGTVSITVTTTNIDPVAVNDTATAVAGVPLVIDVLKNDTDANHDPLVITTVSGCSAGGAVTVAADGKSLTYTSLASLDGTETFTYTITDNRGGFSTATVTVSVPNNPPKATRASADAQTNGPDVAIDMAPYVSDPDPHDVLSIAVVTAPPSGYGTVSWLGRTITYVPPTSYPGNGSKDSFTLSYTVTDSRGKSDSSTLTITLNK